MFDMIYNNGKKKKQAPVHQVILIVNAFFFKL